MSPPGPGMRRDVFPGQGAELAAQAGLVALDGQQVVRAAAVQVSGVPPLSMHRIGGDQDAGKGLSDSWLCLTFGCDSVSVCATIR